MGVIKELLISLGLDVGDTPEKLDDLEDKGDAAAASLGGKLGKASDVAKVGLVGLAGGAVAAAAAIFGLATNAAEAGAAIDDTAKRAGIGTTELQRLTFAANQAGAQGTDIASAFKTLDVQLAMVARTGGGPAAAALKAVGLELEDLQGLSAEDKFALIADGIRNLQDPSEKTAAAVGLFGGAGQNLIPLLNEGSAAIRAYGDSAAELGVILDESAIAKAAELDDMLGVLKTQIGAVATDIGVALMPVVQEIAEEFSGWIAENRELVASSVEGFLRDIVPLLVDTAEVAHDVAVGVAEVAHWFGEGESEAMALVPALGAVTAAAWAAAGPWGALAGALLLVVARFDEVVEAASRAIEAVDPFTELREADLRKAGASGVAEHSKRQANVFLPGEARDKQAFAAAAAQTQDANMAASMLVAIASGQETARRAQALMLKGQRTKDKKGKGKGKKDESIAIPPESRAIAAELFAELDARGAADDIPPTALQAAKKAVAEALAKGAAGRVARDAGFSALKSLGQTGPVESLDPFLAEVLGVDVGAVTSRAAIADSKITPQTLINTVNNQFDFAVDIQIDGARAPDEVASQVGASLRRWFDAEIERTAREIETRIVR